MNPTLRQLTDNTQRSSDLLQKQSTKESKEKAKATRAADAAELSPDTDAMGEDLLGSMDPDMFGGGSGKNLWKDWRRQKEEQEPAQRQQREEGQGRSEERGDRQPEGHAAKQRLRQEGDVPAGADPAEETALNEEAGEEAPPERGARGAEAPAQGADAPLPGSETEAPREEPRAGAPEQEVRRKEEGSAKDTRGARKKAPPLDEVVLEKRRARPRSAEASTKPGVPSSGGLLDWGEGFLLAEQGKPAQGGSLEETWDNPDETEAPSLENAADFVREILLPGVPEEIAARTAALLAVFGSNLLALCRDFGVRIEVLPRDAGAASLPGGLKAGEGHGMRCAYVMAQRLFVVKEEALFKPGPGFNDIVLVFAHGFDHALGRESFASFKSPAVLSNYQSCLGASPERRFADGYAALSPAHYFAQALESYLSAPFGKLTGPDDGHRLFTKEELYDLDRPMFQYIDYLFREINRGALDALPF